MELLSDIKKVVERGIRLVGTIGMVFVLPLMVLTTADVVGRGFFDKPIAGTFELSEYMLAVIILLGAAYTQQVKGHVAVDFLTIKFNRKTQLMCQVLTLLLSLFIVAIVTWQGFLLGMEETGVTDQLRISRAPFKMLVGVGGLLLWIQILLDFFDVVVKLKRREF
ncbi:MAG: Tripartite ATP-independent periplasmic transporter [Syntrophorhabdaceae bacterium PtaU1.Bin034]|jgi:TRAP-type C4-dicarboxylate transport system permease small subunit|nr:MAG: Tripartite ATP-independent periplasmic transporter [Syntrophorhabdaceae bacterium PtaU1.Bin034]